MSEPMFPSPEASAAAPVASAPEADGGSNKALLALGGIGAALVVGAGAFFLLSSGGSSEPLPVAAQPQASAPAAAPSAAPSTAPSAKPVAKPAAASVTGRDPFKPLFATVVTGTGAVAGGGGGATSGGGGGGGGSTTPVPAPAPAVPTVTLSVSKVDSAAQTVTVTVDGKKYNTAVNKPFGTYYTVYSVFNDSCVGILYGDQSVAVCTSKPMTVTP